jgi:glycosyltransferase involved in cell wall biosynthesis
MKALVVVPYYHPYVGGLENYARQLNIALHTLQGMDIVIVTSGVQKGIQTEQIDGMTVYRLGRWIKVSNTPFSPLWTRQIKRLIARERPDVILAHAPVPTMAAAASRAKGKTPFIVVYHAATLSKKGSTLFNIAAWVYLTLGRRLMQRADRIFAVSAFVKEQLGQELQAKTAVVPNAVWNREVKASTQSRSNNFIFIGSLNRSHAWKGLALILQAIAHYKRTVDKNVSLTVLGDGDMRQEYERQAEELGITDDVDFRGTTVGDAKDAAIKEARALIVYPTTANDAFPTVMLEAWSRYTPVIAAAIGPMPSLIHDGTDGILCTAENPKELAKVLRTVTLMTSKARAVVATNAAERTRRQYTWEKQAETVRALIGEML